MYHLETEVLGGSGSSNRRRGVAQAAWKKRGFGRAGADRKAGWHVESAVVGVRASLRDSPWPEVDQYAQDDNANMT